MYPGISPYTYCANNPLVIVDTEGKDIVMFFRLPTKTDFGHIMLQVVDHETGKVKAFWSFGPKNNMEAAGVALNYYSFVEGHQASETEFNNYLKDYSDVIKKITLQTSPEVDDKVAGYIDDRKHNYELYSVFENNCGTTALAIVSIAYNVELAWYEKLFPKPRIVFGRFAKLAQDVNRAEEIRRAREAEKRINNK